MPKFIAQEDVFQILSDLNDPFGAKVRTTEAMRKINALPAADVRENIKGEWIPEEKETWIGADFDVQNPVPRKVTVYSCSQCKGGGCTAAIMWKFCPDCGAIMSSTGTSAPSAGQRWTEGRTNESKM